MCVKWDNRCEGKQIREDEQDVFLWKCNLKQGGKASFNEKTTFE